MYIDRYSVFEKIAIERKVHIINVDGLCGRKEKTGSRNHNNQILAAKAMHW